MNRLGELERAIMDVLWDAVEPLTVRQVGLRLTNRDLAHTTVSGSTASQSTSMMARSSSPSLFTASAYRLAQRRQKAH